MQKPSDHNASRNAFTRLSPRDANLVHAGNSGWFAEGRISTTGQAPNRAGPCSWAHRIARRRNARAICATTVCLLFFGGCSAITGELQTFIAEDPDTGERALYRLEIFGTGIGSVKYHVSGAYLPRTAIELYDGEIPQSLADIDAESPGGESTTGKILAEYHQFLEKQAKLEREAKDNLILTSLKDRRDVRRFFADAISDSMLSVSDLRSISEAGSDDPYRFRKLVYFISTKPLKVQDFQGEIGEIESTLNTIAQAMSEARQQRRRAAEARRTQRKLKLQAVTKFLQGTPNLQDDPTKAWELLGLITGGAQ